MEIEVGLWRFPVAASKGLASGIGAVVFYFPPVGDGVGIVPQSPIFHPRPGGQRGARLLFDRATTDPACLIYSELTSLVMLDQS